MTGAGYPVEIRKSQPPRYGEEEAKTTPSLTPIAQRLDAIWLSGVSQTMETVIGIATCKISFNAQSVTLSVRRFLESGTPQASTVPSMVSSRSVTRSFQGTCAAIGRLRWRAPKHTLRRENCQRSGLTISTVGIGHDVRSRNAVARLVWRRRKQVAT